MRSCERFPERVSLSECRDELILKGGMLVAGKAGLDARSTMDIDAAVKGRGSRHRGSREQDCFHHFRAGRRRREVPGKAHFQDYGREYPGIRVSMETEFDGVITPFKIDSSTGGALAPREVRYSFRLTPEDCSIGIWAYNQETVLAEKLETVGSRAAGLSWHTVMDSVRGLYGLAQG